MNHSPIKAKAAAQGPDRFKVIPVVSCVVQDGAKILALKRFNTGYMDGFYCLPGGHVEAGETLQGAMARELLEETGLVVEVADLELFHILQTTANGTAYLRMLFRTKKWQGQPSIQEPHKCSDLGFYDPKALEDITPTDREVLSKLHEPAVTFASFIEQDRIVTQLD